ncbi:META domain-containing protein [Rhodococcus sp. HNM0569]|uniref:META domain-containing protein n=1 Tax=Rhodococcus sp. HNM0569 TaxID=2716340 RepID=UPI00146C014D|nr:META domain-containing protein [Rhodococcus sp. HNM0569]NLU82018.1 META domain-containing protein [Rhodococcus sp. HNM0569]
MRALALLAGLVLLTACGSGGDEPAPQDLDGRTFVSTSVDGTPIPGGGPLTLSFAEPGMLGAHAGCNHASAPVDTANGTLAVGTMSTTMMACIGERAEADAWMTGLLESTPSWQLDDDTLTVTGADSTVTLTDQKILEPDRAITGTEWTVTALISADAVTTSAALETSAPALQIGSDGHVTGTTGCNRFQGNAEVNGDTIEFGPLATTRMACPPDVMEVEQAVLAALAGRVHASVDGNTMRVTRDDGVGLELRATP